MAGKKVRKERPFRSDLDGPFPDSLPECGVGTDKQIDVHDTKLLDVATRSSWLILRYWSPPLIHCDGLIV